MPDTWKFISGHLPMTTLLKNPRLPASATDIVVLAFVRDPIDRLLSLYNFVMTRPTHPQHAKAQELGPEQFLTNMPPDRQCHFLDRPEGVDVGWALQLAPIERVAPVCADISKKVIGTATPMDHFEKRLNVTQSPREGGKVRKSQISDEVIALLRHKHSRDLALYEALSQELITSWADLP